MPPAVPAAPPQGGRRVSKRLRIRVATRVIGWNAEIVTGCHDVVVGVFDVVDWCG